MMAGLHLFFCGVFEDMAAYKKIKAAAKNMHCGGGRGGVLTLGVFPASRLWIARATHTADSHGYKGRGFCNNNKKARGGDGAGFV